MLWISREGFCFFFRFQYDFWFEIFVFYVYLGLYTFAPAQDFRMLYVLFEYFDPY